MTSGMNRAGGSGWDDVQVGDRVQLVGSGRPQYVGLVDARTVTSFGSTTLLMAAACSTSRMATNCNWPHHDPKRCSGECHYCSGPEAG
jgi:hypothetical protein